MAFTNISNILRVVWAGASDQTQIQNMFGIL